MNDNRLTRNALMAVVQVIITGGVLFLLYRYLLRMIGAEQVGIWAIVLATASASRISEMGFAGSAVKYTAKYIARGEESRASEVIQTTVISIGVVLACVLAGGYPLIEMLMVEIVPSANIMDALAILPYALVSVWFGAVAGVFFSGLDGCQRIDLRVLVSMLATVSLLLLTWLLVPQHGLVGLAWAQIGQGVLMLCGSWLLLRRELPSLPLLPINWSYPLFREMFRYGFNFQIISIVAMLFDPMTKALMVKFGGLSSAAYYEMASRMVMQFRSLLVSANQVIVPQIADIHESAPDKIREVYLDSYRLMFFFVLPLYASVVAIAPLASELWIGHFENIFVGYTLLLAAGYCFNTLVSPAYYVNLGTGLLRWNMLSNVVIGILNVILGYWLGKLLAGGGVALGYTLSLAIGSALLVWRFHRDHQIMLVELFPAECRKLFFVCCISLLLGWSAFHVMEDLMGIARAGITLAVCLVPIAIACWKHPMRQRVILRITGAIS